MIKTILVEPAPSLRNKSLPINKIDLNVKKLINDLLQTLEAAKDPEGVGLSAAQIGDNRRVIVVKKIDKDRQNPHQLKTRVKVLINPRIINASQKQKKSFEGCLSVPRKYGWVERSPKIKVKALDQDGKEFTFQAKDMFAFEIQHEIDHLEGILFIDKLVGKLFDETELDNDNQ